MVDAKCKDSAKLEVHGRWKISSSIAQNEYYSDYN